MYIYIYICIGLAKYCGMYLNFELLIELKKKYKSKQTET